MAIRNIVKDGDPILRKVCRPVTQFDAKLAELLDDMSQTMLESSGLGLAAPQVGVMRRIFIALDESDMPDEDASDEEYDAYIPTVREFINPEIIETSGEVYKYEGCLSFPGKFAAIKRPQKAKIRAFDRNGKPFEFEGEDMLARCLCHEANHLDGITIDELADYYYDTENPHELDAAFESGE